jgi:hypothetical protein
MKTNNTPPAAGKAAQPVTLLVQDGCLHTSVADITDGLQKEFADGNPLLVAGWGESACTIKWPLFNQTRLREALFDAREMGMIADVRSVVLPDGRTFQIDQ